MNVRFRVCYEPPPLFFRKDSPVPGHCHKDWDCNWGTILWYTHAHSLGACKEEKWKLELVCQVCPYVG